MKFILYFYRTALILAIEEDNVEIVKLLLACKNIDVNYLKIL